MSINNVEIQDSVGNIYYPHTDASVVKFGDSDVGTSLSENTQDLETIKARGYITTNSTITDANNLKNNGFYNGYKLTNAPSDDAYYSYIVIARNSQDISQIATTLGTIYNKMYIRNSNNGVWGNWILLSNTKRTTVTATPSTGITIARQNIYIENKTLYFEVMVGKTDGTLFEPSTFRLFFIPNVGINYHRTIEHTHWSDYNMLVNGSGTASLLSTGECYVINAITGSKYISVSAVIALEGV